MKTILQTGTSYTAPEVRISAIEVEAGFNQSTQVNDLVITEESW